MRRSSKAADGHNPSSRSTRPVLTGEVEMSSNAASRHKQRKVASAGSQNGAAQDIQTPDNDSAKQGSASDTSSHARGIPMPSYIMHVLS